MLRLTAFFRCDLMGAHSDSMEVALHEKDTKSRIHAIRGVRTHEDATEGGCEPSVLIS